MSVEFKKIVHSDCGQVAFLYWGSPQPGDPIEAKKVILLPSPDPQPVPGDRFFCPRCGYTVFNFESRLILED